MNFIESEIGCYIYKKWIISMSDGEYIPFHLLKESIRNVKNDRESNIIHYSRKEYDKEKDFLLFIDKNVKNTNKQMKNDTKKKIKLFISYSSKDRELRELLVEGLKEHLTQSKEFVYEQWSDAKIDLGDNWEKEIEKAIDESDVSILLISASFAASDYINTNELIEFFQRKEEENYLIMPVLIRSYNFSQFEEISKLNFFKTYHNEYGFNKPIERNKLLPFDKLGNNENTTDEQLNLYYSKLADFIHTAVKNRYA